MPIFNARFILNLADENSFQVSPGAISSVILKIIKIFGILHIPYKQLEARLKRNRCGRFSIRQYRFHRKRRQAQEQDGKRRSPAEAQIFWGITNDQTWFEPAR
ncbi:hypothetical protein TNIN_261831 [Trichonephila inaurata madagascariensis]|uniref:Uncharacterized protein n=1 Tax=Trichonephila inaurata madagascariensis TaxID=2747483 RepID=A0A8X7BP29_9ARAC|nr:hypothetical protein TNIN_261831 [Trichonephila inaurata madagascariensis]